MKPLPHRYDVRLAGGPARAIAADDGEPDALELARQVSRSAAHLEQCLRSGELREQPLEQRALGPIGPPPARHYWLSIANGKAIARTVAAEIEGLAPERSGEARLALDAYLARLDAAEAEIRRLLADLPTRRIATFHDAFGYFATAYGLEVAAVFEPFPGKEPGPRFVQDFQRKVRATGVRVLFSEPQLSVETLRPIAADLGVTLSILDPLGGGPGRESYVELMLFNTGQVSAVLRAQRP